MKDPIGEKYSMLVIGAILLPTFLFFAVEPQAPTIADNGNVVYYNLPFLPMVIASYFALGFLVLGALMALNIIPVPRVKEDSASLLP